jgi:thioredoxin 1
MNFNEEINCSEPVLVDFYATWCPPCRRMLPVVDELAKEHKVLKVNIDEELEISSNYNISAVPTFIVFKNGVEQTRLVGVQKKEAFLDALI